jgi:uncharacterized protein YjbI with pentapeptide repeats
MQSILQRREQAMEAIFRSWRQKTGKPIEVIGFIAVLVVVIALIFIEVRVYGTGFTGKTLWDWLQLLAVLLIPVMIAVFSIRFTKQQSQTEIIIASDNQQQSALQEYLDRMTEMLLEKNLRKSELSDEVRSVARARTLSVLPQLNGLRKRNLIQFLYEADLLPIVSLKNADLSDANLSYASLGGANLYNVNLNGANLYRADLRGVNLRKSYLYNSSLCEADLSGSNLSEADLKGANLSGANLGGANLSGADLRRANLHIVDLRKAIVTTEQLAKAKSLKGAIMPDGSIHH